MSDQHASPQRVSPQRVVAVLGRGVVPTDTPILRADDLGALRGDGIFETMHVRGGQAWLLEEHLTRMTGSADRLALPLPDRTALAELVAQTLATWPDDVEGAIRLVCTRGPETGGSVTVFATAAPVGAATLAARRDGIAVATAAVGFAADARQRTPWLLGGAKTLSYAVNMATMRWAAERGVDDVVWVSADGFALEGPTSTIVWLEGSTLWTVPVAETGILAGTTARWLLDHVGVLGFTAGEQMITPGQLADADGLWLASSVRGLAEVRSIDGIARKPSDETARFHDLLGFAV